jgi:large subunit ribosomal protein L5
MSKINQVKIEKVVLSIGGTGEVLERGSKLLELLSGQKAAKMKTKKRIAAFGIRPRLEVGVMVTVRKNLEEFLKKFLATKDNVLKKSQVSENSLSFGIKEYIEIPGVEYQRDIGILGLDVTITFKKPGKRVGIKKIKSGKIPKKQNVSRDEIIKFMKEKFNTKFI